MPTCCPTSQIPFSNAATSTVEYSIAMQQQYGATPKVQVWYFDPETGEFYLSNSFFTRVAFEDNQIRIDHGGPASGYIVIR